MNIKLLKLFVSIILLLCLFDMPYGYYQFVRFAAMIGFSYLAFLANKENNKNEVFIYIALALLLQPFLKISLGRTIWNIVDLVVGIGLLFSIFTTNEKLNK
jgi:hypothetical protein